METLFSPMSLYIEKYRRYWAVIGEFETRSVSMFMRIIHRMDLADGASRIFHSIRKMLGNFCWEATSVKQRAVIYNNPSEIYSIKVTNDTSFTDLLVQL